MFAAECERTARLTKENSKGSSLRSGILRHSIHPLRVVEHTRLHDHLPLFADSRIDFANPALPMIFRTVIGNPQRINIDDRKRSVTFFRDFYLANGAIIPSQPVRVE